MVKNKAIRKNLTRKFFLEKSYYVVLISVVLGLLVWIADAILDFFIFDIAGGSFWDILVLNPPHHEVYFRLLMLVSFILFGLFMAWQIHQRKKAEADTKKSSERMQLAIEGADLGLWDWYANTGDVFFSERWAGMLGFSSDEIAPHIDTWKNMVHPEDWPDVETRLNEHLQGKIPVYQTEHRMKTKAGDWKWILARGKVIERDDKGNPLRVSGTHLDINEQKLYEKRLSSEKENLRITLDSIGDAVIATDRQGRVARMNPVAEKLTGWTLKDAEGRELTEVFDIYNAQTRERVANPVKKVIDTGKVVGLANHTMLKAKDGANYQIADSAAPVKNARGVITGVVLVFRDVTEDYRLRKALEESERQMQKAQEVAGMGSWLFDLDTGKVVASKQAYKLYGVDSGKELTISDVQKIPLPQYRKAMDAAMERLVRGEEDYDIEFKIRRMNDGEILDIHSVAEYNAENNTVVGIIHDITNRKKAEEALKHKNDELEATEEELRASMDELKDINDKLEAQKTSLEKARDKAQKDEANLKAKNDELEAAEEELRVSNDELKNINYKLENRNAMLVEARNKARRAEEKLKAKNDELQAAEEELRVSNDHLKEINEQLEVQKEELEEAKEKAEESDRLKSAFLANMSHEVRTPLNGILGFTGLLSKNQISPERRKRYVAIIERNGTRMLQTINDLIDISKIESGQMQVHKANVNLNQTLEQLYEFFKPQINRDAIAFRYQSTLNADEAVIYTDKEKLHSIFSNLIKNAIKFTDAGHIIFGYQHNNNGVKCFVEDTGSGIDKKRQEAVFERFVQADLEYARAKEGSGLGLAITKAYVEALGGEISLQSEPGKGSLFYFNLPLE